MLKEFIELARPHQYIKNVFVFLPAFFAFKLHHIQVIFTAGITFAAFCLAASGVYIFNDWIDRYDDQKHPEKCHRPLASGQIQSSQALICATLFFLPGAIVIAAFAGPMVLSLLVLYIILNIAYSLNLKNQPIIDITCISLGFVIRLLAGAKATNVLLSHWIIIMTFLLALFLSLAKRRDDILIYNTTNNQTRKVIGGYNLKFLDASIIMTGSITILAYILWSISPSVMAKLTSPNLFLTSIFVFLGVLRYMQIAFVEEKSGNPTKILLQDVFIQLTLIGWLGSFIWIIYIDVF